MLPKELHFIWTLVIAQGQRCFLAWTKAKVWSIKLHEILLDETQLGWNKMKTTSSTGPNIEIFSSVV